MLQKNNMAQKTAHSILQLSFGGVRFQDKVLFTKHLHTMLKAGIPLPEALDTLYLQARSEVLKKIIKTIVSDVENGMSLEKALTKHPKVFDEFYISLVSVGEEAGTLDQTLEFLALQQNKEYRLRKKIQGALMYPAIVCIAMFGMGGMISLYVLPKLVDFFESFKVNLPPATRLLLWISRTMHDYGILIFVVFFLFLILLRIITKMKKVRPYWHAFLLRLPLIGNILIMSNLARFGRNLGTLIQNGIPIARGVDVTARTLTNLKFREDAIFIMRELIKGKQLGSSLEEKQYWEYPPLVSRMIAIGEKTGKLDETLLYIGEFYEEEIDDYSKNLSTILEPALLVVIGLVVGFLAFAIISPIYELTGSIRR